MHSGRVAPSTQQQHALHGRTAHTAASVPTHPPLRVLALPEQWNPVGGGRWVPETLGPSLVQLVFLPLRLAELYLSAGQAKFDRNLGSQFVSHMLSDRP